MNENLRRKLNALLSMTVENGATENEANIALRQAQKLLAEHNLTKEDILAENIEISTIISNTYGNIKWCLHLYSIIATNNGVYMLIDGYKKEKVILFGPKSKIELVKELYEYTYHTCITYGKPKAKLSRLNRYRFWTAYGYGFVQGVLKTYQEILEETNSTAIVLDKVTKLKNEYNQPVKKMQQRKSMVVASAYNEGKTDGENTRKAITNTTETVKRITSVD